MHKDEEISRSALGGAREKREAAANDRTRQFVPSDDAARRGACATCIARAVLQRGRPIYTLRVRYSENENATSNNRSRDGAGLYTECSGSPRGMNL